MTTRCCATKRTALIVVDVQNDFCPGGSLAVAGGDEVAGRIAELIDRRRGDYAAIVATQDWHIDPGEHFSAHPDFVDSWPVHCVAGSRGAEFTSPLAPELFDECFHKGHYSAAYSGFEGVSAAEPKVSLGQWLGDHGITAVDVVGIATDYCVRATVLDAVDAGLSVRVLSDLTAGVAEESSAAACEQMRAAGVEFVGEAPSLGHC